MILDYNVICHICLWKLLKGTLVSELSRLAKVWAGWDLPVAAGHLYLLGRRDKRVLPYFSSNFHAHFLGLWADTPKRARKREQSALLIFLLLYLHCHLVGHPWTPPDPSVYRLQAGALRRSACIYGSCILGGGGGWGLWFPSRHQIGSSFCPKGIHTIVSLSRLSFPSCFSV